MDPVDHLAPDQIIQEKNDSQLDQDQIETCVQTVRQKLPKQDLPGQYRTDQRILILLAHDIHTPAVRPFLICAASALIQHLELIILLAEILRRGFGMSQDFPCPAVHHKKFLPDIGRELCENIIVCISRLRLHQSVRLKADLHESALVPPRDADVLHDLARRRVRLGILDQICLLIITLQDRQKRARLFIVSHIHADVLPDGCGRDHAVLVDEMKLIHVQQLCQVLHLRHIHDDLLLSVEHVGCRLRPGEIVDVQIFVHQFELHLIVLQHMYDLFYLYVKCTELLVLKHVPAKQKIDEKNQKNSSCQNDHHIFRKNLLHKYAPLYIFPFHEECPPQTFLRG